MFSSGASRFLFRRGGYVSQAIGVRYMGSDVRFIRVAQPLYVVQMARSLGPNLAIPLT